MNAGRLGQDRDILANPDPIGVCILSARILWRHLGFWLRASGWTIIAALPIVTLPGALAGFHSVIGMSLRDGWETEIAVRQAIFAETRRFLWRGLVLVVADLVALGVMLAAIIYWWQKATPVAGAVLPFLVVWWVGQPLLMPVLVEGAPTSVARTVQRVGSLVFLHFGYSLLMAMVIGALLLVGVILLGPALLALGPLAGLIAVQGTWVMSGVPLPDDDHAMDGSEQEHPRSPSLPPA